jgi:hypothetical protein
VKKNQNFFFLLEFQCWNHFDIDRQSHGFLCLKAKKELNGFIEKTTEREKKTNETRLFQIWKNDDAF